MIATNPRPTYRVEKHRRRSLSGKIIVEDRKFDVYSCVDGKDDALVCYITTRDTLEQLCRRGIPREDAEKLTRTIFSGDVQ